MNPSAALTAVELEKRSGVVAEVMETGARARCIRLPADSAENRLKFLFNLAATSPFFAETAIPRVDSREKK